MQATFDKLYQESLKNKKFNKIIRIYYNVLWKQEKCFLYREAFNSQA